MTQTPAGWYDDGHGASRWWDGANWTEHVANIAPQPAPASGGRGGMPLWGWVLVGAGIFVLFGGLVSIGIGSFLTHQAPINEAKAAIETYDSAWLNADCDALAEATTDAMRADWGYDDCSVFMEDAHSFDEADRDYQTTVVSSRVANHTVSIVTSETYTDETGKQFTDQVTYTVVHDGDKWRIDHVAFAGDDEGGPADHANI